MDMLKKLYSNPLPSSRTGAFYNTFPYPTKISPEAIAVYIACATDPEATVLDAFAGSGSTGIAALLCEHPTERMKTIAEELGISPRWGRRNAVLYDIGTYASFAAKTMLNGLRSKEYDRVIADFAVKAAESAGNMYAAQDPSGRTGSIRYMIWSEVLVCPECGEEITYFEHGTSRNPVNFKDSIICPCCKREFSVDKMPFAKEQVYDRILQKNIVQKKRVPVWVYGTTNGENWDRPANEEDTNRINRIYEQYDADVIPQEIQWGELHRAGYHFGITHLHHFYTVRNYAVMKKLWGLADTYPDKERDAIRLLLLSYNAAHATLMTRVVAKKNARDFVLTSAQSGVLYISKLPVEKNILLGLKRKVKNFSQAYALLEKCTGNVYVNNVSSSKMREADNSIDFIFTDPPFGDFIPYAEVNQINELWLQNVTDRQEEMIISPSQGKDIAAYKDMLAMVFREMYRVLKPAGRISLVFHAAKAKIWEAFREAIEEADLQIEYTNILDKSQATFKQVVSEGSVKGDSLFLLKKIRPAPGFVNTDREILEQIMIRNCADQAFDKWRCYSAYVNNCMQHGAVMTMDAKQIYNFYDTYKGGNDGC